ncbi:LrgB family protein [Gottfriedia sp. NPDC056225]|uniref:LrgB family protein n=1 Tax=Gottfriedia sp. NPDC056225 TaxID=3345751 RepID=UPI0035DEBC09
MKDFKSLLFILLTILCYILAKKMYAKFTYPLLIPIVTSTTVIILLLLKLHITYESYMLGGKWINLLLGPAVVSFAYPLFEHRATLKKYGMSVFISVFAGTVVGLLSGVYLSLWLGVKKVIILSLAAKSVTTPLAMGITSMIGGIPSLTVVYVMIAGISGTMFGPFILSKLKIDHPVSIGLSYGIASHGVGTAKAAEYGKLHQAISSIAMTLSAILASLLIPFLIKIIIK